METTLAISYPNLPISGFSDTIMRDDTMDLSSYVQEGKDVWTSDLHSGSCPALISGSHALPLDDQNHFGSLASPMSEPQSTDFRVIDVPLRCFNSSIHYREDRLDNDEHAGGIFEGVNYDIPDFSIYDDKQSTSIGEPSPTASQCSAMDTCMDCIRERFHLGLEEFPPTMAELSPEEFSDLCDENYPDMSNTQDDGSFVIDMTDDLEDEPTIINLTEESWSEVSVNDDAHGRNFFQGDADYIVVGGHLCPVYNHDGVDFIDLTTL
ncbi:hypothetical protein HIM_10745 [Hirsutella minnesotensis 3608]|uniref:Uncharacterized protein n=1 Tax=Hirsutella minnesotensis 3608 TaxID=1043627 RepID=A0A0F7ZFW9_9HYPO|nr:hypothetical protein HIM_10745 [Hirsutella minnesotensis 3608]